MADNIDVTPGSGKTVLADEITDGTLGTGIAQWVKLIDGTVGGTNKAAVTANGDLKVTLDSETVTLAGTVPTTVSGTVTTTTAGTTTVSVAGTATVKQEEPTLLWSTGTFTASGDGTPIAAPGAGSTHRITYWQVQNEAGSANTILMKFGATTKWRVLAQNQGDGAGYSLPPGQHWTVGDATALILNLSSAGTVGYTVTYYTEAV